MKPPLLHWISSSHVLQYAVAAFDHPTELGQQVSADETSSKNTEKVELKFQIEKAEVKSHLFGICEINLK